MDPKDALTTPAAAGALTATAAPAAPAAATEAPAPAEVAAATPSRAPQRSLESCLAIAAANEAAGAPVPPAIQRVIDAAGKDERRAAQAELDRRAKAAKSK